MSNTKKRIQDTARELFQEKGVQKTSLQDIADRLGITKPALYYHFSSREELVRSIVQPVVDGGQTVLAKMEALGEVGPREILESYFDFHYQYRHDIRLLVSELNTLSDLGLIETVILWRDRLSTLLVGADRSLAMNARAVMALGGIQDITVQFAEVPAEELRPAAIEAALACLGLEG